MRTQHDDTVAKPVELTDDDVAYLLTVLRDPGRTQPLTTQDLIDALRARAANG